MFDFKGRDVRAVVLDAEPWFVGYDTCAVLAIGPSEYRRLDENEKRYLPRTQLGMPAGRPAILISESGLYKLILRSDKPEAKPFQDWVTKTVLPSIRKDGGYVLGEEKVTTGEMSEDELVLKALEVMQGKIARLTQERDNAVATITEHLLQVTVDEWRALPEIGLVKLRGIFSHGTVGSKVRGTIPMNARGFKEKRRIFSLLRQAVSYFSRLTTCDADAICA